MDRPPYPPTDQDTDTGVAPDREPTTGAPRWVKVLGIIVLGLAILLIGLKLAGIGPDHGPGRHSGGGGTPATRVTGGAGHTPTPGQHGN
jgi:hypothetical protein